ncbi:MAG TPA: FecR domain-containing protein [Herbaspirillum sp.]
MTLSKNKSNTLAVSVLCALTLSSTPFSQAATAATASTSTPASGQSGKSRSNPGRISTNKAGVVYNIAQDETLSVVANRFTGDSRNWQVLGKLNHIPNDRTVPVGTPILIPSRLLLEKTAFATISAVHGDVSILGRDGAIIAADVGASVPEGAMIATSAQGFITLTLKDGTYFSVTPASNLQLTLLRMQQFTERPRTSLTLEKGRVSSTVTPFTKPETRYEIHTPLTAAGVRGTRFRVNFDGGKSFNEVLEGTVRVAPPGQNVIAHHAKDLPANYGAVVAVAGQTAAPVVLPDPPAIADGDAVQDRTPVRFSLTMPIMQRSKVRAFRVSVAKDAKGQDMVADLNVPAGTDAAAARVPDLDDGHYYVFASSIDNNGLEGKPVSREFKLKAHPLPPFPIEPGPKLRSSVDGKPVEVLFKWADVGAGSTYHLQIASDAAFTQLLLDRDGLKTPEFLHDAVPPGSFYWRVATVETVNGAADQGPYGDVKPLEILAAQQAPQPSQDEDQMHFSWRGEAGQTFVFEIAATADFAKVVKHIETGKAEVAFARPAAGAYFARVRSIDPDGYQSAFSQAQKFEVFGVWKTSYGGVWNSSGGPLREQY